MVLMLLAIRCRSLRRGGSRRRLRRRRRGRRPWSRRSTSASRRPSTGRSASTDDWPGDRQRLRRRRGRDRTGQRDPARGAASSRLLVGAVVALARAALRAGAGDARIGAQRADRGRRRSRPRGSSARSSGRSCCRACRSRQPMRPTALAATSAQTAQSIARPGGLRAGAAVGSRSAASRPTSCSPRCRARTSSSRSSRATAGSPCRTPASQSGVDRVLGRAATQLARGRVLRAERVPHLADVRRRQLARALDAAERRLGRLAAELRPAHRERPAHAHAARSRDAGWRTVSVVPSNERAWPVGAVVLRLRRDAATARNMGYRGPTFSYARMPDQYTWKHFYDSELARPHAPVMAEIDFVSSHTPWTPLPRLVPWSEVGDGSVFDPQPARGSGAGRRVARPERRAEAVRAVGRVHAAADVLVPAHLRPAEPRAHRARRPSAGADRERPGCRPRRADHDHREGPAVFARIASWQWDGRHAPVAGCPGVADGPFRDRFLGAFSP